MCRVAKADGISTLVAMAHTLNGVYYNDAETILEAVNRLRAALRDEGIPLEVLPGSDVHVDPAICAMIGDGRVMTINNMGRAVMLEFPDYFLADAMCRFVESLGESGIIAVISHPERCAQFSEKGLLRRMIGLGAVSQVTAMSLTGEFSEEIRGRAVGFLEEGLVHLIASDAHSVRHRPPVLSRAVDRVAQIVGEKHARALVSANPRALLSGERPSQG
jgi:protein-tyrosine phosphatase